MATPGEASVTLREGGLLAHAIVARCLEETGGRALVLKGVGAEIHGVRRQRAGADVDVLVPPDDLPPLHDALRRRGWRERPSDPDEFAFPVHSVSFLHPSWPCDIDVHFRFPGLEAPPAEVFEALWERRESVTVAGRDLEIPDRVDSVVILAVHALRSPWVERHRLELVALGEIASGVGVAALVVAARRLGALACVRPVLEPLVAAECGRGDSIEWGQVSDEWAVRTGVGDPFTRRLLSWRRAGGRERLRLLRLAVLPPREVVRAVSPGRPGRGVPLLFAYLRRWRRGLVAVPRAVTLLRRVDAGVRAAARRR